MSEFAVVFEVNPKPERWDAYLATAKMLRPELEKMEGFIMNERYRRRSDKGWLLSLSLWRDEKALVRWRTHALHHKGQERGRFEIFADYRLRIGEVTRDSGNSAPAAEMRLDETAHGDAKALTVSQLPAGATPALPQPGRAGAIGGEIFDSINDTGESVLLAAWRTRADAERWFEASSGQSRGRHRIVRVIRDYGMFERAEAPQYYPAVTSGSRP
jgi:heme-degrading monooxygenase HmoA